MMNAPKNNNESTENSLKIGDYVTIFNGKTNDGHGGGWLCSQGMLGEDCMLSNCSENILDCVWEIYIQCQYAAQMEYRDALLNYQSSSQLNTEEKNSIDEFDEDVDGVNTAESTAANIATLYRAAINEKKLNLKQMSLKIGKPVQFGDAIQLRHVKSNKFLTVSADLLAKTERENMRVTAQAGGDYLSCVSFMPKHHNDKEGAPISDKADLLIRVNEKSGEYIHSATSSSLFSFNSFKLNSIVDPDTSEIAIKRRRNDIHEEVNCSLDSSCWTISIFHHNNVVHINNSNNKKSINGVNLNTSVQNNDGNNFILTGQLITLQDSESLCYLTITSPVDSNDNYQIVMSPHFLIKAGNYGFSDSSVGTSLLWLVEMSSFSSGGAIKEGKDFVTLRHLNSGYYIKITSNQLSISKYRDLASRFTFHNSQKNVEELESIYVLEDSAINICFDNKWFSRLKNETNKNIIEENKSLSFSCDFISEKADSISLLVSNHLYKKVGLPILYTSVDSCYLLRYFHLLTTSVINGDESKQREMRIGIGYVLAVLENLIKYLITNNAKEYLDLEQMNIDFDSNEFIRTNGSTLKQTSVFEQGLLDAVLDLLELAETKVFDNIKGTQLNALNDLNARRSSSLGRRGSNLSRTESRRNSLLEPSEESFKSNLSPSEKYVDRKFSIENSLDSSRSSFVRKPLLKNKTILTDIISFFTNVTSPRKSNASSNSIAVSNIEIYDESALSAPGSGKYKKQSMNPAIERLRVSRAASMNNDMSSSKGASQKRSASNSQPHQFATLTDQIVELCLKFLVHCVSGHKYNQLHLSNRFPIILRLVKDNQLAVTCVEEMLRDNLQLLQTKVRQREIDIFVQILSEADMDVKYIQLIQSTCRCPMGVDSTQRMVAVTLFNSKYISPNHSESLVGNNIVSGGERSLVIEIITDRNSHEKVHWSDAVRQQSDQSGNDILGHKLISSGLPSLWVKWNVSKYEKFSMQQLFGYDERVPFRLICASVASSSKVFIKNRKLSILENSNSNERKRVSIINKKQNNQVKNTSTSISDQLKSQVAEYLISQLYLVADVCLDRNYVSISILEKQYEYETLITILRVSSVPNRLKAPVCKIIRTLYVDREPQVAIKYPNLVKNLNVIRDKRKKRSSILQTVAENFKFSLLQQIISEYIDNSFDILNCDELSTEKMSVLNSLLNFGFYSDPQDSDNLFLSLINILEQHRKAVKRITTNKKDERKKSFVRKARSFFHNLFIKIQCQKLSLQVLAKAYLGFTESLIGMFFIVLIVLVVVVGIIYQFFIPTDSDLYEKLNILSYYATGYFTADVIIRILSYKLVYKKASLFFYDKFNIMDFSLVIIDLIILALGVDSQYSTSGNLARVLRILRLLRLLRMLRALSIIRKIKETASKKQKWFPPVRYNTMSEHEIQTICYILKTLTILYNKILDIQIDLTVKAFIKFLEKPSKEIKDLSYKDINPHTIMTVDLITKIDNVLLDILMFNNNDMLQEAFNLLMIHKSQKEIFFDTAEYCQIIISSALENSYKLIKEKVLNIRKCAEQYEIWSNLESEEDIYFKELVVNSLKSIKSTILKKNKDTTLDIREIYLVDDEIQILLRNLDCFTSLMMLLKALYDGGREELKEEIISILRSCNEVIVLFVKNNSSNQLIAFQHIDWFLEHYSDDIGSTSVVRAILEGNLGII